MSRKELQWLLFVASIAIVVIGLLVTVTLCPPDRSITISAETPNPTVPQHQPNQSASQLPIGLEGYCPVTLVDQRVWMQGDKRWGVRGAFGSESDVTRKRYTYAKCALVQSLMNSTSIAD